MCLSYEHGLIPGNLHYKEPNPQNESLKAGILQVRACASMCKHASPAFASP